MFSSARLFQFVHPWKSSPLHPQKKFLPSHVSQHRSEYIIWNNRLASRYSCPSAIPSLFILNYCKPSAAVFEDKLCLKYNDSIYLSHDYISHRGYICVSNCRICSFQLYVSQVQSLTLSCSLLMRSSSVQLPNSANDGSKRLCCFCG